MDHLPVGLRWQRTLLRCWSLDPTDLCPRSHIHIKKKEAFCHPTRSAPCDKNPHPDTPRCRAPEKVRKPLVNWVACHRRTFARSTISLRDLHRDPGEVSSATDRCGNCQVEFCAFASLFFFTSSSSLHKCTPSSRKQNSENLTVQLMQMYLNYNFNPLKHLSHVTPVKSFIFHLCADQKTKSC